MRRHSAAGVAIPEAKFRASPPLWRPSRAAGDQGLGAACPPIGKARGLIDVDDPLDECCSAERTEQAGAIEIGRNHVCNLTAEPGILTVELRNGDRAGT
mgnify:CR=1 FL=1